MNRRNYNYHWSAGANNYGTNNCPTSNSTLGYNDYPVNNNNYSTSNRNVYRNNDFVDRNEYSTLHRQLQSIEKKLDGICTSCRRY